MLLESASLCHMDDIVEGQARGFAVTGFERKIILVRKSGRVHAWLDSCPHYTGGTPMAWKSDAYLGGDGTYIACHSHGALFDIETGDCILGPCLGQKLTRIAFGTTERGEVHVLIPD